MTATASSSPQAAPTRAQAVRTFGRYQLLSLLGKSERTMAWRVADPRSGQDLVLVLPRHQPQTTAALEVWISAVRRAGRLSHPSLAAVVDSGVVDHWPFVAYDPRDDVALSERISRKGEPAAEVASWAVNGLAGLAFAHDAGVAHGDLQPFLVLLSAQGQVRLMGAAVANSDATAAEAASLAAQRDAAQRDVLAFGLIVHHALAGAPALDQPDVGIALRELPPLGREIIRLPFTTGQPVPDALRAIVNRATDRQERQRYRNARTLLRALQGWLKTEADGGAGPLALLLDRLHTVGLLPASPGVAERAARLALMERERTIELAGIVLQDIALTFELLRAVNTAQVRGGQVAGTGPVLTMRRAIAMLGLDGVRRAALALRTWPGPLDEANATRLRQQFDQVMKAARVAQSLRPAGYDPEVVCMVTLLQSLGRLAVRYHFPDEAQQIHRLMQPAPNPKEGEPDEPGMSEEAAAWAVLGTGIDDLGVAIARHWGLDASVQHMVRRQPLASTVRQADGDDDLLRLTASCGIEAVDALAQPATQVQAALQRVLQRYARPLGLTFKDLQMALELLLPPGAEDAARRVA
ncbi:MAG: HDOD domain-containing protein [Burkholderiaceae bacterium]|nr:HDOD domain-containing protein [Burkholderiaceae bacterium]